MRGAQVAQTIVIPGLIGSLAWFREEILKVGYPWFFLFLLGVFIICQAVLFLVSVRARQSVQDLYFISKDLKDQLEAATSENLRHKTRTELFILTEKFASAYSRSLLDYAGRVVGNIEEMTQIIANILDPLVLNGEEIFGFGSAEKWNFVAYFYSVDADVLLPIWRRKAQTHPSQGLGREWRRGQGHVGFAFANSKAVITGDARNPDVRNLVIAVERHAREYDESTYISFASVPIGPVGDREEPIGVVVATSDRVGRFTSENSRIIAHAALAIANAMSVARVDLATLIVPRHEQ